MAATLKDVAARAGVSVKTVSNVVNGYTFVAEQTRRRVQQAVDELGYVPNVGARNLRRGRTGFIALAVPELAIPYFAELAGLIIAAAAPDWTVLIEQTMGVRERERAAIFTATRQLVDAVILNPIGLRPEDLTQIAAGVPLVLLGERMLDAPADHVAIDNVRAATEATRHLVDIGRRRIAAIGDQPGQSGGTAAQRLAGYEIAVRAAGQVPDPELTVAAAAYHRAEGAAAMNSLLDLAEPPDAVFCFNDLLAIGAIRAARERGVRVPEDVAVVGFDGTEEGEYNAPPLTTVAPDKKAIAETTVELVRQRLATGDEFVPQDVETPFSLEIRESTVGQ
jgi:DNA-binding LacI/PurR family transcriptional regulator